VSFFPASGRVGSQVCSADPGSALDQIEQPGGATRGEVDDAGGELGGALDPAPLPGMLIDPDRGDGIEPGRSWTWGRPSAEPAAGSCARIARSPPSFMTESPIGKVQIRACLGDDRYFLQQTRRARAGQM